MPVIYLVSCTWKKEKEPKPAKDLYVSDLFVLSRCLVEQCLKHHHHYEEGLWFILSSKHYLVPPEMVLEPYDDYLLDKSTSERRKWADKVFSSLVEQVHRHGWNPRSVSLIVLAGKSYWEFMEDKAKTCGFKVCLPWQDDQPPGLKGQGPIIEWRKNWLRSRLEQIHQGDFGFCDNWRQHDDDGY